MLMLLTILNKKRDNGLSCLSQMNKRLDLDFDRLAQKKTCNHQYQSKKDE